MAPIASGCGLSSRIWQLTSLGIHSLIQPNDETTDHTASMGAPIVKVASHTWDRPFRVSLLVIEGINRHYSRGIGKGPGDQAR